MHFEEAEYALQLALRTRDAGDAWPWRTLGEAYLEAGRSTEALEVLKNGLDLLGPEAWLLDLIWLSLIHI